MAATSYNCDCDDAPNHRTLGDLRTSLMRRLGFSAQVDTPPPGMTELLNDFLVEAQELLYRRYDALRTERFYSWPILKDTRFYDVAANAETTAATNPCTKTLDARNVSWAGWSQDGMNWRPLVCGIPPELYNNTGDGSLEPSGYPRRYEIRQCIEIWPNPDQSGLYTLRVKGHFGLEPFAADTDQTTIDDRVVFLLALSNAKAHYGQPDAQNYIAEMESLLVNMVAGSHNTRRYVPSPRRPGELVYVEPRPTEPFT